MTNFEDDEQFDSYSEDDEMKEVQQRRVGDDLAAIESSQQPEQQEANDEYKVQSTGRPVMRRPKIINLRGTLDCGMDFESSLTDDSRNNVKNLSSMSSGNSSHESDEATNLSRELREIAIRERAERMFEIPKIVVIPSSYNNGSVDADFDDRSSLETRTIDERNCRFATKSAFPKDKLSPTSPVEFQFFQFIDPHYAQQEKGYNW